MTRRSLDQGTMDAVMGTAQASLVPGILNQLLRGVGKSGTAMEREMEKIVKREENDGNA